MEAEFSAMFLNYVGWIFHHVSELWRLNFPPCFWTMEAEFSAMFLNYGDRIFRHVPELWRLNFPPCFWAVQTEFSGHILNYCRLCTLPLTIGVAFHGLAVSTSLSNSGQCRRWLQAHCRCYILDHAGSRSQSCSGLGSPRCHFYIQIKRPQCFTYVWIQKHFLGLKFHVFGL
jgi:hypothetical protein